MNPPTPSPGTDYSTRDVAQILGLAVRSVQLMVDRGELIGTVSIPEGTQWVEVDDHADLAKAREVACRY